MLGGAFKSEIDELYRLASELGRERPALAPMLGRDADPAMSRLVEGVAFSLARLRERLDDDLPEVIHPIVDALCPEILRPRPSSTILELRPSSKLTSPLLVKAGASFASRPIDGVACTFRTTTDCTVAPIALTRAAIATDRQSIALSFEATGGAPLAASLPPAIRLFLALDIRQALDLRARLLDEVTRVVARAGGSSAGRSSFALSTPRIPHVARSGGRNPIASAFLDLRDYFATPEASAFVDLPLERCALGDATSFDIEIALGTPLPRDLALTDSSFVLHAVPASNVFALPPLDLEVTRGRGLRADVVVDSVVAGADVYDVERVRLICRNLRAFAATPRRLLEPAISGEATFEIERTPSPIGSGFDVSLAFAAAEERDVLAAEVAVRATNGARAGRVAIGDVCVRAASSPALVDFRNVTPATRPLPLIVNDDRVWEFYRLLKTSFATLTDAGALARVLALANAPAACGWPEAKPGSERFIPLRSVQVQRKRAAAGRDLHLGSSIRIDVDGHAFDGAGDLRLFGERLANLFAATLRSHEWAELTLHDAKSVLSFPRTYGARHGI